MSKGGWIAESGPTKCGNFKKNIDNCGDFNNLLVRKNICLYKNYELSKMKDGWRHAIILFIPCIIAWQYTWKYDVHVFPK